MSYLSVFLVSWYSGACAGLNTPYPEYHLVMASFGHSIERSYHIQYNFLRNFYLIN